MTDDQQTPATLDDVRKLVTIVNNRVAGVENTVDVIAAMLTLALGSDILDQALNIVGKAHRDANEQALLNRVAADIKETNPDD